MTAQNRLFLQALYVPWSGNELVKRTFWLFLLDTIRQQLQYNRAKCMIMAMKFSLMVFFYMLFKRVFLDLRLEWISWIWYLKLTECFCWTWNHLLLNDWLSIINCIKRGIIFVNNITGNLKINTSDHWPRETKVCNNMSVPWYKIVIAEAELWNFCF